MDGRALSMGLCISAAFHAFGVASAHAYRNPERFGADVGVGGGGGRYFTLSRAEGYGCAACHSQGLPVAIELRNLPRRFVLGQPYRITVDWPDDLRSVALNIEMTSQDGAPFGQLVAPDLTTLSAADLCHESDAPSSGQTLLADTNGRKVLLVAECGQAQTTFDWIAPDSTVHGFFSTSVTFSNRDGKLSGDRVVDISEALTVDGTPEPVTNLYQGSCAVTHARSTRVAWIFALVIGWRVWRRLNKKRT